MSETPAPACPYFETTINYEPPIQTETEPIKCNRAVIAEMRDVCHVLINGPLPENADEFLEAVGDHFGLGELKPGNPNLKIPRYILLAALSEMHGYFALTGSGEKAHLRHFAPENIGARAPYLDFTKETCRALAQSWEEMRQSERYGHRAARLLEINDVVTELDPSASETFSRIGEDTVSTGGEAAWEVGAHLMQTGVLTNKHEARHGRIIPDRLAVARALKPQGMKRAYQRILPLFRGAGHYRYAPLDSMELQTHPDKQWVIKLPRMPRQGNDTRNPFAAHIPKIVCTAEMAMSADGTETFLSQLYDALMNSGAQCGLLDADNAQHCWEQIKQIRDSDKLARQVEALRAQNPHLPPHEREKLVELLVGQSIGAVL